MFIHNVTPTNDESKQIRCAYKYNKGYWLHFSTWYKCFVFAMFCMIILLTIYFWNIDFRCNIIYIFSFCYISVVLQIVYHVLIKYSMNETNIFVEIGTVQYNFMERIPNKQTWFRDAIKKKKKAFLIGYVYVHSRKG